MSEHHQLNLRMQPELYERLRANAVENERSINGQVCYIVRQYLDGRRYGTLETAAEASEEGNCQGRYQLGRPRPMRQPRRLPPLTTTENHEDE